MPECSFRCGKCGARKENVHLSDDTPEAFRKARPVCCDTVMSISNRPSGYVKVIDRLMNADDNARWCGVDV